jgi:hypothetical protein
VVCGVIQSIRERYGRIQAAVGWRFTRAEMKQSMKSNSCVQPWVRWGLVVLVLAVVTGLGVSTVFRAAVARIERTDFTVYRAAGRAVLTGEDIYEAHNSRGWAYVYPPAFSLLMVPFARMSVFWGALTWYAISLALTAVALGMGVRLAGGADLSERGRWLLWAVPILPVLGWFVSAVTRGQASVMTAWLVIAAFYWHFRRRDLLGGLSLAGAILIKVFPAVLLAYFVWRRRWRFTAATLIALVAGVLLMPAAVFGWQRNITYLHEWVGVVAKPALAENKARELSPLNEQLLDPQKPRNQSLTAVIWRVTRSPYAREVAAGLAALMALITAWAARPARGDTELLVACAAIVWMLLVPPVSESHYFVVLLLPLAVLTTEAYAGSIDAARKLALMTLIAFGIVSLVSVSTTSIQHYGALCWATVALWGAFVRLIVLKNRDAQMAGPGRFQGRGGMV